MGEEAATLTSCPYLNAAPLTNRCVRKTSVAEVGSDRDHPLQWIEGIRKKVGKQATVKDQRLNKHRVDVHRVACRPCMKKSKSGGS